MGELPEYGLFRKSLGAALITGAAGFELARSVGRPVLQLGFEFAGARAGELASASVEAARNATVSGFETVRPTLESGSRVGEGLRRRARGRLPPLAYDLVEGSRHEFIDAEKTAYYSSLRAADELKPVAALAARRSVDVVSYAFTAFDEVFETSLAAALKLGQHLENPKPAQAPLARKGKKAGPARKRPKRGPAS